ncbi:MAG: glycosyltransferase family 2 protein [Halobacteriota archaeon]
MDISVVIPTLNGRDQLAASLDSLAEYAPESEVVVVNGPSADGTTGMVRDREDVDVLVEISARTLNVARNAGIESTSNDVVALLGHDMAIEPPWAATIETSLERADVVTGPTHQTVKAGMTTEEPERRTIRDRVVSYFNGGNAAFRRSVLNALDGFDEYLQTGGARDAAHRLAALGYTVDWQSGMSVRREYEADGGVRTHDWRWKYRSLAYRLVKNYGLRPTIARRTLAHAIEDGIESGKSVLHGELRPTAWLGMGRSVATGIATGASDGFVAHARDRSPARNPNGMSTRTDRVVARYDLR